MRAMRAVRLLTTAVGLALVSVPLSGPALARSGVLPRGIYLLVAAPVALSVEGVYLATVGWERLLARRGAGPLTGRGLRAAAVPVVALVGCIAPVSASPIPFYSDPALVASPLGLLFAGPAGAAFARDRPGLGAALVLGALGWPAAIAVGLGPTSLLVLLPVLALLAVPALLVGFAAADPA